MADNEEGKRHHGISDGNPFGPLTVVVPVGSVLYFKVLFLSHLCTQHGAQTQNPEIKSHVPHQLNQPSSPLFFYFKYPTLLLLL